MCVPLAQEGRERGIAAQDKCHRHTGLLQGAKINGHGPGVQATVLDEKLTGMDHVQCCILRGTLNGPGDIGVPVLLPQVKAVLHSDGRFRGTL